MKIAKCRAQQGDVTMIKLKQAPAGDRKPISKIRCVLAEGESTGHMHAVEDNEAELMRIGERMILSLGKPATVTHQEHGPITLDAGLWEIGRVQEYDYWSKMARTVAD